MPQIRAAPLLGLPAPGTMVSLSSEYEPAIIKGLTVHKDNPFLFDFIVDIGQDRIKGDVLKQEGNKLIKYFLASLAIPEKDLWVNLSPYEKDRIIPETLSQTDMGHDLLAQDYILKQLTASLIYPEKELGKKFWDRVYEKIYKEYSDIPAGGRNPDVFNKIAVNVGTFNKVWIMADKAEVFERNGSTGSTSSPRGRSPQVNTVFVTDSHLKVMLEQDYLASQKHSVIASDRRERSNLSSEIMREIILPELEHEINTGKHFANLRQIFNSLILASWYKNNLKQALLNQVYSDKNKVAGIPPVRGRETTEAIYDRYLQAYKKGVFNFIKEDSSQGQMVPRKYFSGGLSAGVATIPAMTHDIGRLGLAIRSSHHLARINTGLFMADLVEKQDPAVAVIDRAMNSNLALKQLNKSTFGPLLERLRRKWRGVKLAQELKTMGKPEAYVGFIQFLKDARILVNNGAHGLRVSEDIWSGGYSTLNEKAKSFLYSRGYVSEKKFAELSPIIKQAFGLTSEELRTKAGFIANTISKFENKQKIPFDKGQVELIARALELTSQEEKELITAWQESQTWVGIKTVRDDLFSLALKRMILNSGKSLGAIAGLAGISRDQILQAQRPASTITLKEVRALEKALELPEEYLWLKKVEARTGIMRDEVDTFERSIRFNRNKKGLTVQDLADAVGTRRHRINKYEIAQSRPHEEQEVRKIAEALGVDQNDLIGLWKKPKVSTARTAPTGGIDLNTAGMKWNIGKDGQGVEMNIDLAMLERIKREGIQSLRPVILRITPIVNIWSLFGQNAPENSTVVS